MKRQDFDATTGRSGFNENGDLEKKYAGKRRARRHKQTQKIQNSHLRALQRQLKQTALSADAQKRILEDIERQEREARG